MTKKYRLFNACKDFTLIQLSNYRGVGCLEDLRQLKELGQNRLNVTIGSALDLFGGPMNYEETVKFIAQ